MSAIWSGSSARSSPSSAFADLAALVAQAAAHRDQDFAGVDELDFALAALLLPVGDNPDVGADAGVVEHLFRQGDDGFEPVVFDDPLADVALAAARAAGEERRAVEDDGQRASRASAAPAAPARTC